MVFTREDLLVDISQRLRVMREHETSLYVIPDYLAEEWQRRLTDAAASLDASSEDGDEGSRDAAVDESAPDPQDDPDSPSKQIERTIS